MKGIQQNPNSQPPVEDAVDDKVPHVQLLPLADHIEDDLEFERSLALKRKHSYLYKIDVAVPDTEVKQLQPSPMKNKTAGRQHVGRRLDARHEVRSTSSMAKLSDGIQSY